MLDEPGQGEYRGQQTERISEARVKEDQSRSAGEHDWAEPGRDFHRSAPIGQKSAVEKHRKHINYVYRRAEKDDRGRQLGFRFADEVLRTA
jgi:hypothetical protein